ncbi:MAG TPA: hypothetical protein VJY33_26670 [Isosphaeraceae bacterium]|nr:hypothetical protein [Isosphaeraceae bacterium]
MKQPLQDHRVSRVGVRWPDEGDFPGLTSLYEVTDEFSTGTAFASSASGLEVPAAPVTIGRPLIRSCPWMLLTLARGQTTRT